MLLVGLTGNYGMGKSTVLSLFERLGAYVIDTDDIVHSLLEEKMVVEKIRELLGNRVFNSDGSINKRAVAHAVFADKTLKRSLEDILHPMVFERIDSHLHDLNTMSKVVIVEVPLLFERGYENMFDRTITVYATEEAAICRLGAKGVEREDAELRLHAQLPLEEKKAKSDYIIDNNGTLEETMTQVECIYNELMKEVKGENNTGAGKT